MIRQAVILFLLTQVVMMSTKIEFKPRMDGLDEALISSQLLDNRSKPPPKFPWMSQEKTHVIKIYGAHVNNTHAVREPSLIADAAEIDAVKERRLPDDQVKGEHRADRSDDRNFSSYKEREDANLKAFARNPTTDSPPYGPVQSRYDKYTMPSAQRPFQQYGSGQAIDHRPSAAGSATNNARPPLPRTTASTAEYSDTHHTFPTAHTRTNRPVSRQPVTRLMPGLRDDSPHKGRYDAPRGTGKVRLTLSQGAQIVTQHDVKETPSAGALFPTNARSETTHKTTRDDKGENNIRENGVEISQQQSTYKKTETVESSNVSSNKVDNDSPYDKRHGHLKSGTITIVDEPTEARRKQIKNKQSTAGKVLVSPKNNDLILEDISSEEEELIVLGDVKDRRIGRTRTKPQSTDKTSESRSASKHTRRFERYSGHEKRDTILIQESGSTRSSGKRKTDVKFHSSDDEQKKIANKRRLNNKAKGKINEHDICNVDPIGRHKTLRTGQTSKSTTTGKSICDLKDNNNISTDSKSVLEKEINTKKIQKEKNVKKKKKSKYFKIYPIDDGSETIVRDRKQLDKIAAMFCVESEENAVIRRTNALMQDFSRIHPYSQSSVPKAQYYRNEKSEEQDYKQRGENKCENKQNQINTMVDDDDDDNFRPGVWNCNVCVEKPKTSENGDTVIAKAKQINRADATSTIAGNKKHIKDDDAAETDEKVSCMSGIRNIFRRLFKRN